VFPNPQAAIPLPQHPDLEQYRKLAKDLVKACESRGEDAIGAWSDRWIESLARARGEGHRRGRIEHVAGEVEEFAGRWLKERERTCVLADAQFVIARSHGFHSWPKLVAHVDALTHAETEIAGYETAADAIIAGDEAMLRRLLREKPALIRARSTREHNATLLHYTAANGVEGYRQVTPKNAVAIARILLVAGAEVDAEADVYGGGCTTLGLAATSQHPRIAGNQIDLMQLLIERGARLEDAPIAGNKHSAVTACLANNCPEAAAYLADHGARLDLESAAGIGRMDALQSFFDEEGRPKPEIDRDLLNSALRYAAGFGQIESVEFLLQHGADIADGGDDGQTPTHYSVIFGRLDILKALLKHHPPLESRNRYGGTVLGQALWSAAHGGDPGLFIEIIETLLEAGAQIKPEHPRVNDRVDAFLASRGSVVNPDWHWFGEKPRKRKS
jgi:hypothetical protein